MFYGLSIRNGCLLLPEARKRSKEIATRLFESAQTSSDQLRPAQLAACSFYNQNNFFAKLFLQVLARSIKLTLIRILFYEYLGQKVMLHRSLAKLKMESENTQIWAIAPNYDFVYAFCRAYNSLFICLFVFFKSGKIFSYLPRLGRKTVLSVPQCLTLTLLKLDCFWRHLY